MLFVWESMSWVATWYGIFVINWHIGNCMYITMKSEVVANSKTFVFLLYFIHIVQMHGSLDANFVDYQCVCVCVCVWVMYGLMVTDF